MKLLVLDQFSDMGGAQQQLLDLLPAFGERGWKALVGLPGNGEMFQRVWEAGFVCREIACGPYRSGSKSARDMARFVAGAPLLAGQIRNMAQDARLVYINGPRLLPAAALARLRQPVLFHSHSFLYPGPVRTLAGFSLRRMDAWVVGACDFVADPWRPFVRSERISVIYNGVAGPDQRPPEPTRPVPAFATPRVGCIGRIAPEKGQREFLRVAAIVHQQLPETRFVIYGDTLFVDSGVQRYANEVRAAAADLPVEFAGWVPNVYEALTTLDLLLVPSMAHEATTRVIPEAFAAGVPVVAMRSGGIPEVVDHGRNGYLADSVEEMADLAVAFLKSRPDLSGAARDTWERRFRVEWYRRQVADLMERISAPNVPS